MNVSLSSAGSGGSAGDVTCGNAGMLMGPSHTIAVNKCIPSLTIAPTGRVVLSQGIKIGSEGNCDASGAGTLRYEAAQRLIQFCDGTVWQEVGAAPALSGPFTAVTGANPNTVVTSNAVTVTGFAGVRTATATGGATLMVNGTAVGSTANVNPGNTVALRVTSSGSFDSAVNVGFSVTSIIANWSVTTRAQDTTPNSFTFTNLTNQAVSTTVMSNVVTVAGFDGPLSVSISGQGSPQIQIAGGSWAASGSINPGQTLRARLTTSSSLSTTHGATVSLGTFNASWTATTPLPGCNLPWGGTIAHGASVTAFQNPMPCGACTSELRICSSGVLSGSYANISCSSPGPLIAATGDAPTPLIWGPRLRRNTSDMWNGASHTAMLAAYGESVHPAASYCANLTTGGYDDWYLPAREELQLLYNNRSVIGGFSMTGSNWVYYWSSTESTSHPTECAWALNFSHGWWHGHAVHNYAMSGKDINGFGGPNPQRVRCVRRPSSCGGICSNIGQLAQGGVCVTTD